MTGRTTSFSSCRAPALLGIGVVLVSVGCATTSPNRGRQRWKAPSVATVDAGCRLVRTAGDTRLAATGDGEVFLIGEGLGVMRSVDAGTTFRRVADPPEIHWPSITSGGRRAWASWIERGPEDRAVVASVGDGLGAPIIVLRSELRLIDTELLALDGGGLLLFVSEVDGRPNAGEAVYVVHCLGSSDGGLTWRQRSVAVSGPFGVNIEDPRAVLTRDGTVLLAFEWEARDTGPSKILIQRSADFGRSWSSPTVLWDGGATADCEPGGFVRVGRDLWFVASTDADRPGTSYSGAEIAMIRSPDHGVSWSDPRALVGEPDQISMGAVLTGNTVLLPSIRRYADPGRRFLAIYRVDSVGWWLLPCAEDRIFSGGFEEEAPNGGGIGFETSNGRVE